VETPSVSRFRAAYRMYPDGAMYVYATKADVWEHFEVVLLMAEASTAASNSALLDRK
jgi:hypothetical protein